MAAFALDGKLSLDARNFQTGARKAKASVTDIGDEFGKLPGEAKQAGKKATDNVDSELGKLPDKTGKTGKLAGESMGGKMIAGFGALGVGAIMLDSMLEGLETERITKKVTNAFRRTPEEAAEQGKIAGDLYAANWGASLGELENNIALTNQRIGDLTLEELERVTVGATAIADTFDVEYEEIIRSVGQLLENDLAPTAEAALDIVTAGFQDGANEADDFLETIDEYSQHWAAMGLSGEDALGMIQHGFQNGQRDGDKMADAIKEMFIRTTDGSTGTVEAFERLGFKADEMGAKFAAGGEDAREAYITVINALKDVEDPIERTQLAVALVGTQYEDLGPKALESLSQIADGTEDIIGRNEELTESINNQASEWDLLLRDVSSGLAVFGENAATFLNDLVGGIDSWFTEVGKMGAALGGLLGTSNTNENQGIIDAWTDAEAAAAAFDRTLLDGLDTFEQVHAAVVEQTDDLTAANIVSVEWNDKQKEAEQRAIRRAGATKQAAYETELLGKSTVKTKDETEDLVDAEEDLADALADAVEQLYFHIRAQRRSADSAINAREAQFDFRDELAAANEELAEGELTLEEAARLGDELALSAGRMSDAQVQLAIDTATARGETTTATQQQDIWNDAMIRQAATADGPLRDAILAYIGDVNDVPPEKLSEISALIDEGSLEEANRLLDETSETRRAAIIADSSTADAEAALNWLARPRSSTLRVNTIGPSAPTHLADGTDFHSGGVALVGEQGPELVNLPRGSQVFTAAETQRMLTPMAGQAPTGPTGSGSVGDVMTLIVEGEPITARIVAHETAQSLELEAGVR